MKRAVLAMTLCLAAGAVHAQLPALFTGRSPVQMARASFDSEYGQLMAAELGRIVRLSADPDCLKSKGIEPAEIDLQARELLVRNGTRILEIYAGLVGSQKLDAALARHGGPNAKADVERLRNDPDVRRYNDLMEPAKFAQFADFVAETIDRRVMLSRLGLLRRLAPIGSANAALLRANPEERSIDNTEDFVKSRNSPAVRRWRELEDAMALAALEIREDERIPRLGPIQITPDLPADLANLCVAPGRSWLR